MNTYFLFLTLLFAFSFHPLSAYLIQQNGQIQQVGQQPYYDQATQTYQYYQYPTQQQYTTPYQTRYIQSPVNQTYTYPYVQYNPYNTQVPANYQTTPSYQPSNRGIMQYYFGHD